MIPIVKDFQDRHRVTDMVIAADAGMLSAANLTELDDDGMRFIVGSRQTKAPDDLATFFTWNGTNTDDGQLVDTLTLRATVALDKNRTLTRAEPVWSPAEHPHDWRAVWQYRRKRAVRDRETLNLQRDRAMRIIDGESKPKAVRFCEDERVAEGLRRVQLRQSSWTGRMERLRHQYRSHDHDGTLSRKFLSRPVACRAVISDVEDRPASPPDLSSHT